MTQFKSGQRAFAEVMVLRPTPDADGDIECIVGGKGGYYFKPEQLHPSLPQIESELTDDERFRAQLAVTIVSGNSENYNMRDALRLADDLIAAVKATRKEGA